MISIPYPVRNNGVGVYSVSRLKAWESAVGIRFRIGSVFLVMGGARRDGRGPHGGGLVGIMIWGLVGGGMRGLVALGIVLRG